MKIDLNRSIKSIRVYLSDLNLQTYVWGFIDDNYYHQFIKNLNKIKINEKIKFSDWKFSDDYLKNCFEKIEESNLLISKQMVYVIEGNIIVEKSNKLKVILDLNDNIELLIYIIFN